MTLNRRIGLGITLGVDTAGGTTYVTLGSLVDCPSEGGTKADVADITILSDTHKQKAKGQIDPNEATVTIAYDPDDATTTTLKTLHDSITTTPPRWLITFPSGTGGAGTTTTKSFQAHVTGMGRPFKKDGMLMCDVTLTKTGDPGI